MMIVTASSYHCTVLCEDITHVRFVRFYLKQAGFNLRRVNIYSSPSGRGSGEQWVRNEYPRWVNMVRSKNFQSGLALIVMVDADKLTVEARKKEYDIMLEKHKLPHRTPDERIVLIIPKRNIETWLKHLDGNHVIEHDPHGDGDDYKKSYSPAAIRNQHAITLRETCRTGLGLLPSLAAARQEWQRLQLEC